MQYDRRRATDEHIGYLTGKLEEFGEALKSHLAEDASAKRGIHDKLDKLEDKVSEKFTTVETIFKVIKFTGLAIIAVLTFHFGDITNIWHTIFK